MNKKTALLLGLLGIATYSGAIAQNTAKLVESVVKTGSELVIPYQKYVMPNGLTVVLTEDHSDPIAHVDVTYHVGSAREQIGKSGFAHFFEHMMFQGSDHVPNGDHFRLITEAGGTLNGTTNLDRTNYFETVPSNQLEKMLWLESDRMGFLLDAVTQRKFEVQRATVKNERGQNYDNKPYGLVMETISKNLYPYGHPYSWLTIGYIDDLNRVGVNDLKDFFLRWYGPNNATITIGGDIDVKQTLAWVEKYFGSIRPCPAVDKMELPAPVLGANRYVSMVDNYAKLPLLSVTYPGVKMFHKDMAALDALSMIIGNGPNSIFYKNFVKTRKAVQASMYSSNAELAGTIGFQIVPYAGLTLTEMNTILQASLTEFEQKGVSDQDLERFKTTSEADFINSLSSISGKVSQLAFYQTFTGDPNKIGSELQAIRNVSKEDVIRVYNQYVKGKSAVILSVLPKSSTVQALAADNYKPGTDAAYKAPDYGYGKQKYVKAQDSFNRSDMPAAGPNPVLKVPSIWTSKTKNGIRMMGTSNNEIPSVYISLSLKGGAMHAVKTPEKAGLAGIVAAMMNEDTQSYTKEQFSAELGKLGSEIGVGAGAEEISIGVSSLTKNLDKTLALLQERLFHPKFSQESLDRIKKQALQQFETAKTQAGTVAGNVYSKVLYGKDNIRTYAVTGNEKTVASITLEDVQKFYNENFSPDLVSVVVVGDITEEQAKNKLTFLSGWPVKKVKLAAYPTAIKAQESNILYLVNIPKAAQSEIRIGYLTGVNYDATGTSYRLGLANYPLGGGFNSRINLKLREDKGWTYGASSGFSSGRYGGSFTASASVLASATDSSVVEFINQMKEYTSKGVTDKELDFTRKSISQSEARKYETNQQKAAFLSSMQKFDLKPEFVKEQSRVLETISVAEINKLATQYLNTDKMVVVVVGDKERIMPGLQKTGFKIVELNADGEQI
ncbi:M16 family metallopeptidase [Desertivirga arenae]|uniref:M16 family metallopeptidase n=1 Tax=Desertivirga arenae TaxID=2810309 RepID=UPI001A96B40F|nr:pitrilysin family protein [Pedobacter sp. SYSU D00823]